MLGNSKLFCGYPMLMVPHRVWGPPRTRKAQKHRFGAVLSILGFATDGRTANNRKLALPTAAVTDGADAVLSCAASNAFNSFFNVECLDQQSTISQKKQGQNEMA